MSCKSISEEADTARYSQTLFVVHSLCSSSQPSSGFASHCIAVLETIALFIAPRSALLNLVRRFSIPFLCCVWWSHHLGRSRPLGYALIRARLSRRVSLAASSSSSVGTRQASSKSIAEQSTGNEADYTRTISQRRRKEAILQQGSSFDR